MKKRISRNLVLLLAFISLFILTLPSFAEEEGFCAAETLQGTQQGNPSKSIEGTLANDSAGNLLETNQESPPESEPTTSEPACDTPKPTSEPTSEPEPELTLEPASELTSETTPEPLSDQTSETTSEATSEQMPITTFEPEPEPVSEPVSEPAAEPASESVPESPNEPVSESAPEPTSEISDRSDSVQQNELPENAESQTQNGLDSISEENVSESDAQCLVTIEDDDHGNVSAELLEPFVNLTANTDASGNGTVNILLKNESVSVGKEVTLHAEISGYDTGYRVVWEAKDNDENGWQAIAEGIDYSYTLTPDIIEREYRVVIYKTN